MPLANVGDKVPEESANAERVAIVEPVTLMLNEAAPESELRFELVGTKSAVRAAVPKRLGVQEHVALYVPEVDEATVEQPVIAVPPYLNVTEPGVLIIAVMEIAVP